MSTQSLAAFEALAASEEVSPALAEVERPAIELPHLAPSHLAPRQSVDAQLAELEQRLRQQSAVELVERRDRLSQREFVHEYLLPRRPVILTDATRHWRARDWTPQLLQQRIGARQIEFRGGQQPWPFDALIDAILASSEESPAPYARNLDVERQLPELWGDVRPRLSYATPDHKSSRLLPRDWLFRNALEELFIGGAGARFPMLHIDYFGMDGFISQLYGEKEFLIFSPNDTPYLYPDAEDGHGSQVDNFDEPDFQRWPLLAQATPIRFVLRPGETFYQPNGWWHTTRMREVSITLITASWNRANWPALIRHYRYFAEKNATTAAARLKTRLTVGYLRSVGWAHSLRDRLSGR